MCVRVCFAGISNKHSRLGVRTCRIEGVVVQQCNPLTLQPEQSSGVSSKLGRAPPLERHDKRLQPELALGYLCDPSAKNRNFTFTLTNLYLIEPEM